MPSSPGSAFWRSLRTALERETGTALTIASPRPVGGGCINRCYLVPTTHGAFFVKLNAAERAGMFAAEADSLTALCACAAVRVPQVICHGQAAGFSFLALEHLELRPLDADGAALLGRHLALQHRCGADYFGWPRQNTIGLTPQRNHPDEDWTSFWRGQRLGAQLELAAANGYGAQLMQVQVLLDALPAFFAGYQPVPSLLHGDLWSGNIAQLNTGEPVTFDPAVYYGDREADIAMTELFGRPPQAFYDAYAAAWPLDANYAIRRPLYNLYHLLNHLNLFGAGYLAQVQATLAQLVRYLARC